MHISQTPPIIHDNTHAFNLLAEYITKPATVNDTNLSGPQLILSQSDFQSIKTYERDSLALPVTLPETEKHLGFEKSTLSGLNPSDFLDTYKNIRQHAESWKPIEDNIGLTGSDLYNFSVLLVNEGGKILEAISEMALSRRLELNISETVPDWSQVIPLQPLEDNDRLKTVTLSGYLKDLSLKIETYERHTSALYEALSRFSRTLQADIIPDINHKIILIKKSSLDQNIQDLNEDITRQEEDIEALGDAPKSLSSRRHGGGLSQARAVDRYRTELSNLKHQKHELEQSRREIQKMQGSLRPLQDHLNLLQSNMQAAQDSASQLNMIWQQLKYSVQRSAEQLSQADDTQKLFGFFYFFAPVLTPWRTMPALISQLLKNHALACQKFSLLKHSAH